MSTRIVVTTTATQTPNLPTHTFSVNLAPINLTGALRIYGLEKYKIERDYAFKAGLTTLNLYAPKGEMISGDTLLEHGATIKGGRFGLSSFLALVEDQKSIPTECRGKVVIVCETVLVGKYKTVFMDKDDSRYFTWAHWDRDGLKWVVSINGVGYAWLGSWLGSVRLARRGK